MNRALGFVVLPVALLALLALAGCGKSDSAPQSSAPTPVTSGGSTGATAATPPTSVASVPRPAKLTAESKQFAKKLDAACRRFDTSEAEVYYSDAIASGEDPKSDLNEMLANYRGLIRAAAKLDPPAASQEDFDAYVNSLRALEKQSGSLSAALDARNKAAIQLGAENCIMDSAD